MNSNSIGGTMEHHMSATLRTETGKALNKFRKSGRIPANVFERNSESRSIWLTKLEFEKMLNDIHEGSLVYLKVDKEKLPVILRNVEREYRKGSILHANFQKINLKEEVTVEVSIQIIGEAPALKENLVVETPITSLEIKALPTHIPEQLEVDISEMRTADDQITAGEVKLPEGVTLLTDPGEIIVAVVEPTVAEEEVVENETAQVESVQAASSETKETEE